MMAVKLSDRLSIEAATDRQTIIGGIRKTWISLGNANMTIVFKWQVTKIRISYL